MSQSVGIAESPSWQQREHRVAQLLTEQRHAEPLLSFYLNLLKLQEPLYREGLSSDWLVRASATNANQIPSLQVEHLPVQQLLSPFKKFLQDLTPFATDVLVEIAQVVGSTGNNFCAQLLDGFLSRKSLKHLATSLECEIVPLEFFPHAFFQPIVQALVELSCDDSDQCLSESFTSDQSSQARSCPQCGWLPQIAIVRDETEIKGRRLLVCSLCASSWTFPRSTCPNCGETNSDRLSYHVSDSMSHVRVEECLTCQTYIKSVDLRQHGYAVPLVEDLASVELDLWSVERKLNKIQKNLLGL